MDEGWEFGSMKRPTDKKEKPSALIINILKRKIKSLFFFHFYMRWEKNKKMPAGPFFFSFFLSIYVYVCCVYDGAAFTMTLA